MVGKLYPQLHQLNLSGLTGITDTGLLPLLESFKAEIVMVNLTDCLNLTDEVVLSLARLHGKTLENLNLDGCRRITCASLVAISALSHRGKVNLQVLPLSGLLFVAHCPVFTVRCSDGFAVRRSLSDVRRCR
ncbi:hypothetical protein BC332_01736 [Capsicum chinense]|nr:hypothetical protein BC332_01736 [Capsicum chinense]